MLLPAELVLVKSQLCHSVDDISCSGEQLMVHSGSIVNLMELDQGSPLPGSCSNLDVYQNIQNLSAGLMSSWRVYTQYRYKPVGMHIFHNRGCQIDLGVLNCFPTFDRTFNFIRIPVCEAFYFIRSLNTPYTAMSSGCSSRVHLAGTKV